MPISQVLRQVTGKSGSADPTTGAMHTTPWAWTTEDGVYVGWDGSAWLYRALPLSPLQWEDGHRRLDVGGQLHDLLADLGETSLTPFGAVASLSINREIHLLQVTWETLAEPPEGTPAPLREYLVQAFDFTVPQRTLFIGVRLRSAVVQRQLSALQSGKAGESLASQLKDWRGVMEKARESFAKSMGESVPDMSVFEQDRQTVDAVLQRRGARTPTKMELSQLESHYNLGRGPDVQIVEERDHLVVDRHDIIEFSAVMRFGEIAMSPPGEEWMLSATSHTDAPHVVSVRAELEPSQVTRTRLRRSARRALAQIEEEQATGDLDRPEFQQLYDLTRETESALQDSDEAFLSNCSILMGRRTSTASSMEETFRDGLKSQHAIESKPLPHRQLDALDETLPASAKRVNPFLQDLSIPMIAYSGINGFGELGDGRGLFGGLVHPDYKPFYLDVGAASRVNQPAAMLVAGDSGSGKTFFCQVMAVQAAKSGTPVVFINPKSDDDLSGLTELTGGTRIALSDLERNPGALDPFRFADPVEAAEMATTHILNVLVEFSEQQELALANGLRRGAEAGAGCVGRALEYVSSEYQEVVDRVRAQAENSLFRLAISDEPVPDATQDRTLTLIEIDRPLTLPARGRRPSEYNRSENLSLATLRLITRTSLHLLLGNENGGMLVVDESWAFLNQPEALADLDKVSREGRSQRILPVFATQRVADVVSEGRDLQGYLSRVFLFQTQDPNDARAGLQLCRLEPTDARISWLRDCGPRRVGGQDRWAAALHRDIHNQHAAVLIGPVPDSVKEELSTNAEDRARMRGQREASQDGDQRGDPAANPPPPPAWTPASSDHSSAPPPG